MPKTTPTSTPATYMSTKELLDICGIPTNSLTIGHASIELGTRNEEPIKVTITVYPKSLKTKHE
jgi:hypothetical protein